MMNILFNKRCLIGEGPIWNEFNNKLYHVNGYGEDEICCIDLENGKNTVRKLERWLDSSPEIPLL